MEMWALITLSSVQVFMGLLLLLPDCEPGPGNAAPNGVHAAPVLQRTDGRTDGRAFE